MMEKQSIVIIMIYMIFLGCLSPNAPKSVVEKRDFRQDMRLFVGDLSDYAKGKKQGFIVITQNGNELHDASVKSEKIDNYLAKIDGVAQESLFYGYPSLNDETPLSENRRLKTLLDGALERGLSVLVIDYCSKPELMDDSYYQNMLRGYISFAASRRELDNIPEYPLKPNNMNNDPVKKLKDAGNFLYIINPDYKKYPTKDKFINALKKTDYDIIFLDLFFHSKAFTPEDVENLKLKAGGGSRLILAYMSIGEVEDYRYYWKSSWKSNRPEWLEKENPNWPGNYKVRYWYDEWQKIIYGSDNSYLDKIIRAGFDGVYLDIIDAFYYFESMFK